MPIGQWCSFPPEHDVSCPVCSLTKGKAHGFVGFGGGYIYSLNPKIQIFAGALIGLKNTWYKRYDSSQILGDDGVYYIQDDDGDSMVISPGFGLLFPNGKGNQFIIGFDANPMNIYLGYSWKSNKPYEE